METNQITIQSEAFKAIMNKLELIHRFVKEATILIPKEQKEDSTKKWLQADEAATILNISRRTLLRIRSSGELSFFKIGKRIMYYADEINNYEKKQPLNTNKEEELRAAIHPVIRKRFRKNKPKH